jgi:hypothetical protein
MKKLASAVLSAVMVFISVFSFEAGAYAQSYEDKLIAKGFPKTYVKALCELHAKYPNWIFEPLKVNIDWQTAVNGERSGHSKQLIEKTSSTKEEMYCTCSKCTSNGKPIVREGGSWVAASETAVKYYMDPRNWLDEKHIFQFESVLYDGTQTKSGVEAILGGTWMADSLIKYKTTAGKDKTYNDKTKYSDALMTAANDSGMSAYYLAAKIRQENGSTTASTTAVCGTKAPFQGIYNYYNIGAYSGGMDALEWAAGYLRTNKETTLYSEYDSKTKKPKGDETKLGSSQYMSWRANKGDYIYVRLYDSSTRKEGKSGYVAVDDVRTTYTGDTSTGWGRPWSNPYKSIYYGAKYISRSFKSQYTNYLQKFNVSPSSDYLYSNEYMKNVKGAVDEAVSTYNGYKKANILGITKKFYIPVYENMPVMLEDNPLEFVSNTEDSVTFSWTEADSAKGYEVQLFQDEKWVTVQTVTDTTATVAGLKNCKRFKFRVRYFKGSSKKREFFGTSLEETFATKPAQVEQLFAEPTNTTVTLTWTPITSASGYYIYMYDAAAKKYKLCAKAAGTDKISKKIKNLKSSTKYKFKVCAYKKAGGKIYKGTRSSAVSVKTKSYTVKIRSAESTKSKRITVKWKKITGADGYEVMWSTTKDFSSNFLSEYVGADKKSKTIKTSKSNTNYYVRVRAYKLKNGGKKYYKWSKKIKVKTM